MNRIIRIWNQNRKQIIIILLGVIFFIVIVQVLNQMAKQSKIETNTINTSEYKEDLPTQSIITGETVSEEKTKQNVEIIDEFVQACNMENIEKAYGLLTEGCKDSLFPTIEDFKNSYYDVIFKYKRTIKIENYKNSSKINTYKVSFYEDTLSTGSSSTGNGYKDYISVDVKDNKLNLNSLITVNNINAEKQIEGINVKVVREEIYKDYEIFKVIVENSTDKDIAIDTGSSTKKIYISDENYIKYTASIHEIASNLLKIPAGLKRTYDIKFIKNYNSSDRINNIFFTDIVQDYEMYEQGQDNEKLKIQIEW